MGERVNDLKAKLTQASDADLARIWKSVRRPWWGARHPLPDALQHDCEREMERRNPNVAFWEALSP